MATVAVEIRRCMRCLAYGWASDNWRETMVFNFNNYCLVEVSVLYRCLDQFIAGTPIQTFFATLLQPLSTDTCWLYKNPHLAKRYLVLVYHITPGYLQYKKYLIRFFGFCTALYGGLLGFFMCVFFYFFYCFEKKLPNTSAVSSINLGSILIFASCVII